jgi:lipopolysaccharide export system protein LptA
MAASPPNCRPRARLVAGCAALLLGSGSLLPPAADGAQPRASRRDGDVTLDAASSDVDYRSNTVVFRDIVITQGAVRVAAAQARASGLDFEDSTWNFTGAVRITVEGGALRSDDATVRFGANRVSSARIRGAPAEFEQARTGGEMARGRAATIEYDVAAGTVKLIGDAWLSDGRNEIRGQQLTYDVRGQRVQSGTRPGQSDRVQITIRPREADAAPEAAPGAASPGPGPVAAPQSTPAPAPAPAPERPARP